MQTRSWVVAGWFVVAALIVPASARAFGRTLDQAKEDVCLWWAEREVGYYINELCSDDTESCEHEACFEAVRSAFQAWTDVSCSDFTFVDLGLTDSVDVGFDTLYPENNINLVIWQEDEWEHEVSAIALTTTTYDTNSGLIVDTDIELNGHGQWLQFACDGEDLNKFDIQNTLAHEAGHALGLDHSELTDATMNPVAITGEIEKRDLSEDDINGICFMYPSGELTPPYYLQDGHQLKICGKGGLEGYFGCQCGVGQSFSLEIFCIIPIMFLRRRKRNHLSTIR